MTALLQAVEVNALPGAAWSPYVAGALIGGLVLIMLVVADKTLGASTGYARIAGQLGRAVAPDRTRWLQSWRRSSICCGCAVMRALSSRARAPRQAR